MQVDLSEPTLTKKDYKILDKEFHKVYSWVLLKVGTRLKDALDRAGIVLPETQFNKLAEKITKNLFFWKSGVDLVKKFRMGNISVKSSGKTIYVTLPDFDETVSIVIPDAGRTYGKMVYDIIHSYAIKKAKLAIDIAAENVYLAGLSPKGVQYDIEIDRDPIVILNNVWEHLIRGKSGVPLLFGDVLPVHIYVFANPYFSIRYRLQGRPSFEIVSPKVGDKYKLRLYIAVNRALEAGGYL